MPHLLTLSVETSSGLVKLPRTMADGKELAEGISVKHVAMTNPFSSFLERLMKVQHERGGAILRGLKVSREAGEATIGRKNLMGRCTLPPFRPYRGRQPWHTGYKAALCRLFPRYGNYCGPNWSSGRDDGSLLWDAPPVDWLDHCCYLHDLGYDSLRQADLHRADIQFLQRLEKGPGEVELGPFATAYRGMCIFGLKTFMLPYRKLLLGDFGQKNQRRLKSQEEK